MVHAKSAVKDEEEITCSCGTNKMLNSEVMMLLLVRANCLGLRLFSSRINKIDE